MTLFAFILPFIFSVSNALFFCAAPIDFQESNPSLYTKEFESQEEGKEKFLHLFLYETGTKLGNGAYGVIKEAVGIEPKLVIKRVASTQEEVLVAMKREIDVLKILCDKDTWDVYNELFECKFNAIAEFKGCVEAGYVVYIFQERLNTDLNSLTAKKLYRSLSGGRKAQVMVDLIRKYQQIHDKKIVHSDIKPENIMMKTNDFSDLRVVDFGMAGKVNEASTGGSSLYLAPERFKSNALSYGADIYSLALSFAVMEEKVYRTIDSMPDRCFKRTPGPGCREVLLRGLEQAFNKDTRTDFLLEVFKIATDYDPKARYSSMNDFAEAITEVAQNLPGFGNNPDEIPKGAWDTFLDMIGLGDRHRVRLLTSETEKIQKNLLVI